MSKMSELRVHQQLAVVAKLRHVLTYELAMLVVVQQPDGNITEDTYLDYCLDFGPDAEELKRIVDETRDNPNHYLHPSKLT